MVPMLLFPSFQIQFQKNIIYKDRWFKMFQLGLQDLAFRCWTEIIGLHFNFFCEKPDV